MNPMLNVMQHALGLNQYGEGVSYRNHYVAGGTDVAVCREAVAQGFMKEHPSTDLSGGSPWFSVTREGKAHIEVASPPRPPEQKLSRSQRRYRRFLTYGDMFDSFLAFCRWDAEPGHSWNS